MHAFPQGFERMHYAPPALPTSTPRQSSKKSAFDTASREPLDNLLVEYQIDDQSRKDR